EVLALEQTSVLRHLLRGQGWDPGAGSAGRLGCQRRRRWWRRGWSRRDALELRQGTDLESQFRRWLAACLRVPDKPQDHAEAGRCEKAPVLLVRDLPYLEQHERKKKNND